MIAPQTLHAVLVLLARPPAAHAIGVVGVEFGAMPAGGEEVVMRSERCSLCRGRLALGLSVSLGIALASPVLAQTTTSSIEGRVLDPSGAGMPGATVEVKGATITRQITSDPSGFYRAVALPAGSYTVTVSRDRFKTKALHGITVLLNRTVTLDVPMELAGLAELVSVEAPSPLVDRASSASRQVIDSRTIEAIPLNSRNYLDLVLLTPGVAVNDNARAELPPARDTRGTILGERAGNAAFLVDGLENNDDFRGGVFQSYTHDAIQEFEVIAAGYKAEFGRGSGGVVNVVTKGGTNATRGSAFFYLRNDALDASNVEGAEPPKLERYNSGLTLGGPLVADRSWYFGSFEHFKEIRGSILPPNIPEVLQAGEGFSREPETTSYRLFGKYAQSIDRSKDLRVAASWTRVTNRNELATATSLPSAGNNNVGKTFLGTAALTTIFGPRSFLESSLGFRDQHLDQNQDAVEDGGLSVFFLDDGSGFDLSPPAGSVLSLDQKYLTLREVLTLFSEDRHAVKVGAEYTRTIVDGVNGQGFQVVIVTVRPLFDLYGRDSFQIPQGVGFLAPGDERTRLRNNGISLFAQDDWRVARGVTLNLGLRYDYDSRFDDGDNLAPRLGITWNPDDNTVVRANWGLFYDRYRLGIAQPVPELGGFNGRPVVELDYPRLTADALIPFPGSLAGVAAAIGDPFFIHEAFGIPLDAVVTRSSIQALTGLTPEQFLVALDALVAGLGQRVVPFDFSPSTGFLRQDLAAGFQDEIRVDRPFRTPHNRTFLVGVQRAVLPDLSVALTYVHRSIRDVLGLRLTNLARESRDVGSPVTTDGGPLQRTYGPFYAGTYDGFIVAVEKRFRKGYQLLASYTYSKATDNLLNSNLGLGVGAQGGGAVPTDSLDLEFDRGKSDLSVPHVFVLSGIVSLPAGFRLSGVLRATSGVNFTAVGPPTDYDGDGIMSMRPAGTSRNQFTGPSSLNLDLRVEKRIGFGKRSAISLLAEAFNAANARNPRLVDASYVEGGPGPRFGTTRVPLPGREIQLGVRLEF
jgi:outer membrane receptor protein involved in Fe transport